MAASKTTIEFLNTNFQTTDYSINAISILIFLTDKRKKENLCQHMAAQLLFP